jgi:hypothetical protein
MAEREREGRAERADDEPLATENAAMPQDEGISEFGELRAKERLVAANAAEDTESGGVAEQRAYLRREERISEEERRERADKADMHNTPNVQHKD